MKKGAILSFIAPTLSIKGTYFGGYVGFVPQIFSRGRATQSML